MTVNKRFRKGKSILTDFPTGAIIDEETGERYYDGIKPSYISSKELVKILNEFDKENNELKEEIQLLKEGMKAYENAIPYVCTCEQVRNIHSEMFDFNMKQNEFYKEHPSRCTVIIDGVRYE